MITIVNITYIQVPTGDLLRHHSLKKLVGYFDKKKISTEEVVKLTKEFVDLNNLLDWSGSTKCLSF